MAIGMLHHRFPGKVQFVLTFLLTAGTIFIVFAYRVMPIAEAQAITVRI